MTSCPSASPLVRSLPWREPEVVARALACRFGVEGLVWLDGDGSPLGRTCLLGVDPVATVRCEGLPGVRGARDPFAQLSHLAASGQTWLGWLAYEAGAWVEPASHWKPSALPLLWAARFDPLVRLDRQQRLLWLEGHDPGRLEAVAGCLQALEPESAAAGSSASDLTPPAIALDSWRWHTDRGRFAEQVAMIQALIASGDLFQANLTACCEAPWPGADGAELLALYGKLRRHCPAPFSGLVIARGGPQPEAILSASPERFLQVSAGGAVETRPIKGTRPRHRQPQADAAAAAALVSSPKDRAENVMIVDLLRNDLGRVCRPGSIQVPQLVGLESFAQVHHLTSVVQGQLRDGLGPIDLLRACWPGGSITGAPKLRACQRLAALEPVPRGPYCGSLFRLEADGSFDSSILIRSVMLQGGQLRAHAGGGIVADSDPLAEAEEMGWKLRPLLAAMARTPRIQPCRHRRAGRWPSPGWPAPGGFHRAWRCPSTIGVCCWRTACSRPCCWSRGSRSCWRPI
ncbi:MAG: anthranilate synthase component I family protein [Cyanobacteriota bacterium]